MNHIKPRTLVVLRRYVRMLNTCNHYWHDFELSLDDCIGCDYTSTLWQITCLGRRADGKLLWHCKSLWHFGQLKG
jgi:hypothetical protein